MPKKTPHSNPTTTHQKYEDGSSRTVKTRGESGGGKKNPRSNGGGKRKQQKRAPYGPKM